MALINDPDDLNQATEIVFNTTAKTIQALQAGNLSADGLLIKTTYSFTDEEWKDDANLIKFGFPFTPITDEFFEIGIDPSGNATGWTWADALTRNLQRRGGWRQYDATGNEIEHWAGFAILDAEADDQIYYDIGAGPIDFVYIGNTQEAVQIRNDPNGDGNYADGFDRSANLTAYNRQQGQIYSSASTTGAGEANLLAPKLFSLSLATGNDLNVTVSDNDIDTLAPYTGMSITYYPVAQSRSIGGVARNYGIIIDANGGTAEQAYAFERRQLRLNSDIDVNTNGVLGKTADELLTFVGGTGDGSGSLETLNATNPAGGGTGVFIDNTQGADVNRISYRDNTAPTSAVTSPRKSTLILEPNANLQGDAASKYFVFMADPNGAGDGNEFDTAGAVLLPLDGGGNATGLVSGQSSISLQYDFDGDTTGGRTAGEPVPLIVIGIGAGGAQYFRTAATLNFPSTTVAISSAVERNFENPA